MKNIVQRMLAIVLLALTLPAFTQDAQLQAYDVNAVVARALEANPTIKAARQQVATAAAKVDEAKAAKQPKVQAQAGYLQLADDPTFTVAGMGTMTFGKTDNPFANVSLQWPIYSGRMIENMIAASRHGVDAAWQGYARTRQEVAAEAAVAYYQALSAQQMVGVMQGQITTLKEAVRIANGLHDQGMVAKLDVLRPTSDLAAAQAQLVQVENGVQLALTNLRRIMNLPADAPLTLAPTAESPLAVPAEITPAVQSALALRPETKQHQAAMQATESMRKAADGANKPHLGMQVQYDFERPTTYPDIGSWSIGLMLQQSLYDGGTTKAQRKQAASQYAELQARQEALNQGITMQVTNAVLSLQAAEERVKSAATAKSTAEEAFRAAQTSYKEQVVPMIDVLAAQTALTNAAVQLELAQFDRQAALVQYHLALGDYPDELKSEKLKNAK